MAAHVCWTRNGLFQSAAAFRRSFAADGNVSDGSESSLGHWPSRGAYAGAAQRTHAANSTTRTNLSCNVGNGLKPCWRAIFRCERCGVGVWPKKYVNPIDMPARVSYFFSCNRAVKSQKSLAPELLFREISRGNGFLSFLGIRNG
jgi:hypothetical protein